MEKGAFALIDCLGFKGIWQKKDPIKLLSKLKRIQAKVISNEFPKRFGFINHIFDDRFITEINLLSDTIAISVKCQTHDKDNINEKHKMYLIIVISLIIIEVLDLYIIDEPKLILRGCVSFGEHIFENNFIVGPAVDETANYMNLAQGAFVWFLPKANIIYNNFKKHINDTFSSMKSDDLVETVLTMDQFAQDSEEIKNHSKKFGLSETGKSLISIFKFVFSIPYVVENYKIPLKTGEYLCSNVINPMSFYESREKLNNIIQSYSEIISGDDINIWLKKQNTLEFLRVAAEQSEKYYSKFSKLFSKKKST